MQRHSSDRHRVLETPTGKFAISRLADGTIRTGWVSGGGVTPGRHDPTLMPELADRLMRYFDGEDVHFDDVPLPQSTAFFRRCWSACREIPRGETISYAELARRAGLSESAARAAGQAMRRNPQPIITPCHRVIGSTGRLHGFAGSTSTSGEALGVKRFLLDMERCGALVA